MTEGRWPQGKPPGDSSRDRWRNGNEPTTEDRATLNTNPGWLDQESHVRILVAVAAIGGAGWLIGYLTGDPLLTFMATFLVVYAAFMIVSVTEVPFLGSRVEDFIEEWVREGGKFSFYGLMAAAYFVKWEAQLLIQEIRDFELDTNNLMGAFFSRVLGVSLETLMNAAYTLIWPFHAIRTYTLISAIIVVAICWVSVRLGARAFFTPEWMLEDRLEEIAEAEAEEDGLGG